MRLYIGGNFQGKFDYVKQIRNQEYPGNPVRVLDGEECLLNGPEQADILNHFHLLIRRLLKEGRNPAVFAEQVLAENPGIWIICDEVGMGIVPADAFEREYRETVGRCCCDLAKDAEQVVRIICGIGERIK